MSADHDLSSGRKGRTVRNALTAGLLCLVMFGVGSPVLVAMYPGLRRVGLVPDWPVMVGLLALVPVVFVVGTLREGVRRSGSHHG